MGKDSYYFSHDSNARNDPKILAMRSVYGIEGYGAYWVIIEMLREQENYRLKKGKYMFNAIAMQMQSNAYAPNDAKLFVEDCINEFELLDEDETHIWSNSLLKRMEIKDEVSEKRREAAKKRWDKVNGSKDSKNDESKTDANAMQMQSKSNAIKEKEKKEKERKEKEIKVNQLHENDRENSQEQKSNMNDDELNPIKFYQKNGFGAITPHVGQKVYAWADDLSNELVIHAMKIAIENNVLKWNYVESILKDWDNRKIGSVEQVNAIEMQRSIKGNKISKDEKVPQWLVDQKAARENKETVVENEMDAEAIEQRKLLLAKLGVEEDGES